MTPAELARRQADARHRARFAPPAPPTEYQRKTLAAVARDLGLLTSGPTAVPAAAFIECGGWCTDFCCAGIVASASCIRRAGHRGACQCGG